MANYANLLATIAANIYSNNNQEITGDVLQLQLNAGIAGRGRSSTYSWGGMLTACVAQKLWMN